MNIFANDVMKNKVVLVTGGATGIGKGIASLFGQYGAKVMIASRKEQVLVSAVKDLQQAGVEADFCVCDIREPVAVEQLMAAVRARFGGLDILVNNVFKIPDPPAWDGGFWEHPVSIWDDQVGIGCRAHYVASWHAAPLLFESSKRPIIINITSSS